MRKDLWSAKNKTVIYIESANIRIKRGATVLHCEMYCDNKQMYSSTDIVNTAVLEESIVRKLISLLSVQEGKKQNTEITVFCSHDNITWKGSDVVKQSINRKPSQSSGSGSEDCWIEFCSVVPQFKSVTFKQNGMLTISVKDEAKICAVQAAEVFQRCNHRIKQRQ